MASAIARSGDRRHAHAPTTATARALEPAEMAWLAALPCALLTLAAIVTLGPPLGDALLSPERGVLWPTVPAQPQPQEHGRFLVGLLGPPLLAAVVLASGRARIRLSPVAIRRLVLASQLALLAFLAACFAAQNNVVLSADFTFWPHAKYFTWQTIAVALALVPLAPLALRRPAVAGRLARLVRETPARRAACLAAAGLYTAIWMLTAVDLDSSIGNTIEAVSGHILWTMDEPFAVLNGRTPLVDFHAQYGQLWAYLAAVPMALFGATIGAYTIAMASGTALAMLAAYALLCRLVRSSLVALALYLPFVATSFFMVVGPPSDRYGPANIFILWPIRYAGPFVLAWLTARHVDGAAPRRVAPLFVVAGLVVLNNPDFGLAATAATLVAIACAAPPRSWGAAARLLGRAAAGLLVALALLALLTLVRTGSLPRLGLLLEFSRLYGIDGWEQLPMPELGLHLAIFLTFAAALVVAAVRVAAGAGERLLTSMLAWSGTFGLLASVYYAGRAHPMALFDFFAPWALAIVLLLLVVTRNLAARSWRRPLPAELAVLFGFGLVVCSLPQVPPPWTQVARIRDRTPTPVFKQLAAERLVARTSHRGERVAILTTLSHRVAYDAGVENVSPYSSIESIATPRQLQRAIDALRRAGGRRLYVALQFTRPEELAYLRKAGFTPRAADPGRRYVELDDESAGRG